MVSDTCSSHAFYAPLFHLVYMSIYDAHICIEWHYSAFVGWDPVRISSAIVDVEGA